MKILIYFSHPRVDRSEISGPMFLAAQRIDGITTVDLYADYPTFQIDVPREQERLVAHDAIIFLHPLYWYSAPALVREWQDLVLEHGFAYGHDGHALDGKVTFNAVSCGASADAYTPEGANGATVRDLLVPFEKTADLCRMHYLAPLVLFGAGRAVDEGRDLTHLEQWTALVRALRDDTLDMSAAKKSLTLNAIAAALITEREVF